MNPVIAQLRTAALDAFKEGLAAADPELAVKTALESTRLRKAKKQGDTYVISIGKAACKMASSCLAHLGDQSNVTALAVTNYENLTDVDNCRVMVSGHPIPDGNGLMASKEVHRIVSEATQDDVVIMLISGGASALLPAPVDEISLDDKIAMNEILLKNNFDIYETNLVRQSLSTLKGGGLARLAMPARVYGFILSDVIGDDLRVVASGPTVDRIGTREDALSLLTDRTVLKNVPPSILDVLNTPEEPAKRHNAKNRIIGGNHNSVSRMAKFAKAEIVPEPLIGDVRDASTRIVETIEDLDLSKPIALAWGGETTVQVTGSGKGGRNQELALRVAQMLTKRDLPCEWVFLSGATDGRDGPTDTAGGLVDPQTLQRLASASSDLDTYLAQSNSYAALEVTNDLIMTGATGTNVADLQLFLSVPKN